MNEQRKVIYKQRIDIMKETQFDDILKEKVLLFNQHLVDKFIPEKSYQEEWQKKEMIHEIYRIYGITFDFKDKSSREDVISEVNALSMKVMNDKKSEFGEEIFNEILKRIFLLTLDQLWKEHLHSLDRLKAGINLRAYGQKDPLNEYKFEAFDLFENMFLELDEHIITATTKVQISHQLPSLEDSNLMKNAIENKSNISSLSNDGRKSSDTMLASNKDSFKKKDPRDQRTWGKVSRNEPCPCGSKKKFKHCHGSISDQTLLHK